MTPEDQKHWDELNKLYIEYSNNAKACDTYAGARKWIDRAAEVGAEMWELKHGPM